MLEPNFAEIARGHFGVDEATLIEALLRSGNARGYILGAVSELLLQRFLAERGFQSERIKEKWQGDKLHHGDYYVRREVGPWYVLESKGLKSNAEKWHGQRETPRDMEKLLAWFKRKKSGDYYEWWKRISPERQQKIAASGRFPDGKILETHFVSGTAGRAGRKIATPRKSEFHFVSLDLFLRTGKHEFVFARSVDLQASAEDPEHLRQNYILDIVVPGVDDGPDIPAPWTRDIDSVFGRLEVPCRDCDRQVDNRAFGARADGVDADESED